jgi:flagellar basal body rod protein FlgG
MNVRTATNNISNKQIKSVKLFLHNFTTMFYKVVSKTIYSSKETTTPIILKLPHYIEHTPLY